MCWVLQTEKDTDEKTYRNFAIRFGEIEKNLEEINHAIKQLRTIQSNKSVSCLDSISLT